MHGMWGEAAGDRFKSRGPNEDAQLDRADRSPERRSRGVPKCFSVVAVAVLGVVFLFRVGERGGGGGGVVDCVWRGSAGVRWCARDVFVLVVELDGASRLVAKCVDKTINGYVVDRFLRVLILPENTVPGT